MMALYRWVSFSLVGGLFWVALPATFVWGWFRWAKRFKFRKWTDIFSLVGFSLATISALIAASAMLYARLIHGFAYYDAALLRIFAVGAALSIGGLLVSLFGVAHANSLRWHAPVCSADMILFWLVTGAGE